LQLTGNPAIAEGYSGCNQFSGSWQMTNDTIVFGPAAMTMMACIDGMEIEQRYMQALSKPVRFAIDGDQLRFYSGSTELLAFRATR
jgi:heat shock protein HslJ